MKRDAFSYDVLRLVSPATGPTPTGSLDIAVLGGLLVERREQRGELELRLFGRLDGESAALLESSLLARLPTIALLDLTSLDTVEPAAIRKLIDRQCAEHRAGREWLVRIAPNQASELSRSAA